jgi:hypothetical protein
MKIWLWEDGHWRIVWEYSSRILGERIGGDSLEHGLNDMSMVFSQIGAELLYSG